MRVPSLLSRFGSDATILNIGSGNQNYGDNVINIDISKGKYVHVLADAHSLPFISSCFDCVILIAVLEHLAEPWKARDEVIRVLRTKGFVYVEAPFMQPYHAVPRDYFRYTILGCRSLFRQLKENDAGVLDGPASAVGWILTEFGGVMVDRAGHFEEVHYRYASKRFMIGKLFMRFMTGLIKYLDIILLRKEHSYVIAAGVYYLGQKV